MSKTPTRVEDQLYRYAEDFQKLFVDHNELSNRHQTLDGLYSAVFDALRDDTSHASPEMMLKRLCHVLSTSTRIPMTSQCALFLVNGRGNLIQVAQLGLQPLLTSDRPFETPGEMPALEEEEPFWLSDLDTHFPRLERLDRTKCSTGIVLPLRSDRNSIGALVLLTTDTWRPDAAALRFLANLGFAVAAMVKQHIAKEVLHARELEVAESRVDVIRHLSAAAECRDNNTGMHLLRMARYAVAIGEVVGLTSEELEHLLVCAPMHDVGKIGIPDSILLKAGSLEASEMEIMKSHTSNGERLLDGESSLMRAAREIAVGHHERWDGLGYPHGLAGDSIPLFARICAVADVFDALTTVRPYKPSWSINDAANWIRQQSGTLFDPQLVAAFDIALPKIMLIRDLYCDDIDPHKISALSKTVREAPEYIRWSDDLSVHIDMIDQHHKHLVDLINDLYNVVTHQHGLHDVLRILRALNQYAEVHFRAEERMMQHFNYSDLELQQSQHSQFENQLRQFEEDLFKYPLTLPVDMLIYLKKWLVGHILCEDKKLLVIVSGDTSI